MSSTHQSSNKKAKPTSRHGKRNGKARPVQAFQTTRMAEDVKSPFVCLPLVVLINIFHYAAQPLINAGGDRLPTVKWLLETALICYNFAKAALSVLYYAPPLVHPRHARKFTALLSRDPATTFIEFRKRVKYLSIETALVLNGNLIGLLPLLPALKGIGSYHPLNEAAVRHGYRFCLSRTTNRPIFTSEFFQTLLGQKLSLTSWTWNFDLNKKSAYPWQSLENIHGGAYFRHLQALTLQNYDGNPDNESLISAIRALPALRNLSILAAWDGFDEFWPALPGSLESLRIFETEITADQLLSYLQSSGNNLRELVLGRNKRLSMGFCAALATTCTRLIRFSLDNLWSPDSGTPDDLEGIFSINQVPTWPSQLQELTLSNLSRLGHELAEVLFRSIIKASSILSDLRKLIIKASINMPYRERAIFRQQWVERFRVVYLRQSQDLSPISRSFKTFAASENPVNEPSNGAIAARTVGPRRRPRITARPPTPGSPFSSAASENTGSTVNDSDAVVQGLCSTVDIRIDNNRPRRHGIQYADNDFLDDEIDGDSNFQG